MFRDLTKKLQEQFRLPKFPKEPIEENSLPFKIGSNISIKNYNKFLESRELSGYKLEYNNGNVFIIDMCTQEHEGVVVLLQDYFKIPNGGVIINPPIIVSGQPLHPSPNANIAPNVAVYPDEAYIPRPPNTGLGHPPSDTRGNSHARIVCEVAVSQSYRGLKNKCKLWMSQQY
ncbi:1894_t:CDS:2, partial [Paraglomus brasilianum]